jgi:hypothetical protein
LFFQTFEDHARSVVEKTSEYRNTASYRSVEFLADQFAVRHGSAVALASALDKRFKIDHKNYGVSAGKFYGVEAARHGMLITGLFMSIWPTVLVCASVCMVLASASTEEDDFIPSPLERLSGIKKDLIQLLKDPHLPPSIRKRLLQDVEFVDTLRADAKSYDGVMRFLWKNFFPNGRRQTKLREFQKGLEDLIHNDLFLQAQRLKSLSTSSKDL